MQYIRHLLHAIHWALITCKTLGTCYMQYIRHFYMQYIRHLLHAIHKVLITCNMLCATMCKGIAPLLPVLLTEFKLHLFLVYLVLPEITGKVL